MLVFANPADPITAGFARFAADRGLVVWQPEQVEDVAWSFHLEGSGRSLEIADRRSGQLWTAEDLAGIWYQSLPPVAGREDLSERDWRYVAAELGGATRVIWNEAPCPVVGQPPAACPSGIFDLGLESRIQLRRLGLPVLRDWVGTLARLQTALRATAMEQVRVTCFADSRTFWLSDLFTATSGDDHPGAPWQKFADEPLAATVTDGRSSRIAVYVDGEILVVEVGCDGLPRLASVDDDTREIERVVQRVRKLTSTRVGITYLGHHTGRWQLARVSLQIPYWLADLITPWLFPRLFTIFSDAGPEPFDARQPR